MTKPRTLRDRLASISLLDNPKYEPSVHALLEGGFPDRGELRQLMSDEDDGVAFNALTVELTLLARDRDFAQYREQVDAARPRFKQYPRFLNLEAVACRWSTDEHTLSTGLGYAMKALEAMPDHPGYYQVL